MRSAVGAARSAQVRLAQALGSGERSRLESAQIEASRSARLQAARGAPQRFTAEQMGVVETLAAVVRLESPRMTGPLAESLALLGRERGRAENVFVQIEAVERARLTIWGMRFEGRDEG